MLKQIWIAECDLCGATEPAKTERGRYNDVDYVLPEGWKRGKNEDFCICTDCARKHINLKEEDNDKAVYVPDMRV